ncbi:ABC transporter substrate-binding protein [Amycolatopsis sp. lyj-109]|uniref:ABC transporter substrate-binding protein n=1 Tax=Amycolatopsis sp. lyj-109 TaxID=2789287 RepID=UPI003979EE2F
MSSRRLGGIATATSLALALTACGASDAGTSGPAGNPVSGGTLTYAINTDADCLDPHQSPADVAGFFARPILDSLVALDAQGKVLPWLAKAWTVSPDGKTYTFQLRDGVTFSNGEPFDAAAVKANFDHVVNPKTQSKLAAGTISTYTGARVVDAHTVEIGLSRPSSAFLPAVATAYLGIEAPSTLTQDPKALCSKIVGTGPFVSTEGYTPQKGIDYTRRADYKWPAGTAKHQGPAYLDGLKIQVVTENSSRLGALTSGQVDAIASVPPVNVAQLKANPGFTIQTAQAPGGNYSYYPNTQSGPFTDLRVRQAFRSGIDWDTIVSKLYFGVFQPAKGPLAPSTVAYDKSVEPSYAYDAAKANQLLDQAGWTGRDAAGYRTKDGTRLTLVHPFLKAYVREQRDVLADQLQAAAKQLGIEIKNENVDYGGFLKLSGRARATTWATSAGSERRRTRCGLCSAVRTSRPRRPGSARTWAATAMTASTRTSTTR